MKNWFEVDLENWHLLLLERKAINKKNNQKVGVVHFCKKQNKPRFYQPWENLEYWKLGFKF